MVLKERTTGALSVRGLDLTGRERRAATFRQSYVCRRSPERPDSRFKIDARIVRESIRGGTPQSGQLLLFPDVAAQWPIRRVTKNKADI